MLSLEKINIKRWARMATCHGVLPWANPGVFLGEPYTNLIPSRGKDGSLNLNHYTVKFNAFWRAPTRGMPGHLRNDNRPEFFAKAVRDCLEQKHCSTIYSTPGSPWEKPYIESFNILAYGFGKFRMECLNRYLFRNGFEAQKIIESWRGDYYACLPSSPFA
jgi:hypothetical protein